MAARKYRLGTRGSRLALWQSNWVRDQLVGLGFEIELVTIKTEGDSVPGPLMQIGGQGLFTKRIQSALLEAEVDFAVHSLKDLPTEVVPGLQLASVPQREDPRDALLSRRFDSLESLPHAAAVGTGSMRRAAQLKRIRPDLRIADIRGNVETRIKKMENGEFDAIVLAVSGLNRLGLEKQIKQIFNTDQLLPAVGQGALGIETRVDDSETVSVVERIKDTASFQTVVAERAMLRNLQGGCIAPIGARSQVIDDRLTLTGAVLSEDGSQQISASETMFLGDGEQLGVRVASALKEQGAHKLLRE